MALRDALRDLTPPALRRAVRDALGRGLRFEGDYPSWEAAQSASGGYDGDEIVQRVFEAELKVHRGEAADARDGVTFSTVQFCLPVMAALARAASARGDGLRVLDFGGAFGGLYRQYRAFGLRTPVQWTVVEQPTYVERGAAHFQTAELRFSASLDEAVADAPADVVLLSSVLQYLPEPHAFVRRLAEWGPAHVVLDRTPCSALARDVLAVQRVPAEIYRASYPCWIFSRERLLEAFRPGYTALAVFTDGNGSWHASAASFELAGFLFDRRS
jgi:putative methyltransferase (TIGR04325 family)